MTYCSFCEYTGIIKNPDAYITGGEPLTPCPKCVQKECKCDQVSPYLYLENGTIKECSCKPVRSRIERINRLISSSDIDKKFRWRFLSEFHVSTPAENRAKTAAYKIMTDFNNTEKGLYLWGNPGTGKTMLSAIILTELIVRYAVKGKFLKISRNFFGKLRSTFHEGSTLYGMSTAIEQELADIDVLVVDDFGIQRDSEWEQETLYNLVDARYEKQRFTIFTSNLNPIDSMQKLSNGRILSRIREMCRIMELSGKDHRESS
jgi:DNA replication protein DnaC